MLANRRQPPRERDDGPTDADIERFSDVTQKCPKCGTELYDDVEICWSCGYALGSSAEANAAKGVWIAIVVGVIVLAFVAAFVL